MLALHRSTGQSIILNDEIFIDIMEIDSPYRARLRIAMFGRTYDVWISLRQPFHILPDVMIKLLTVIDNSNIRIGVQAPQDQWNISRKDA